MPVDRIARLTPGFHRARSRLGIATGSPRAQAVAAVVRALAEADILPEHADLEASFHPSRAFVRRVPKHNLWVWFRVDADHVTLISITDEPPIPFEE